MKEQRRLTVSRGHNGRKAGSGGRWRSGAGIAARRPYSRDGGMAGMLGGQAGKPTDAPGECCHFHVDGSTVVGAGLSSRGARAGYKLNGARAGTGCRREHALGRR